MSDKTRPVNIRLLDKEYTVACPEEEREDLLESAQYLTGKMQEIREGGKNLLGAERIAVMAALNIAHEFLQQKQGGDEYRLSISKGIRQLEEKIERSLGRRSEIEGVD